MTDKERLLMLKDESKLVWQIKNLAFELISDRYFEDPEYTLSEIIFEKAKVLDDKITQQIKELEETIHIFDRMKKEVEP